MGAGWGLGQRKKGKKACCPKEEKAMELSYNGQIERDGVTGLGLFSA